MRDPVGKVKLAWLGDRSWVGYGYRQAARMGKRWVLDMSYGLWVMDIGMSKGVDMGASILQYGVDMRVHGNPSSIYCCLRLTRSDWL